MKKESQNQAAARPLFLTPVAAGFPSPADEYVERDVDLNAELVRNPPATFFVRATGQSMRDAPIRDGDILVVDRSLTPTAGRVVLAVIDGELTVKRLQRQSGGGWELRPDNPDYPPLRPAPEAAVEIWGVVTYAIHKL